MIRNGAFEDVEVWTGLDTFSDAQSLTPAQWADSSNVVVQANGNVMTLRSPANFNPVLSPATGNAVLSCEFYDRTAGGLDFFDISSASSVGTYSTDGSTNTMRRANQANVRWQSQNVNNCLFRVNGVEFIQYPTGLTAYSVGITAPASAPSVSIVAGGSGTISAGVTVSYAYRNSTTGHVGECSAASGDSGTTSGGNHTLRVAVVASTQIGVDGIVLFITEDGGSVRYLYTDAQGDPNVAANTTTNIDISVDSIFASTGIEYLNLNVEETAFNQPPPTGITFISSWKNRLVGTLGRYFVYSGFDAISYGVPWECWPGLNIVAIPNKAETAQGGIETPLGWLALSDRNAYLLSGVPTDKVDSGENTLQITEQFNSLGWNTGTRSILTLQNCPYGSIFLDQDKKLQFWAWSGSPVEFCPGLRTDLATILDTTAARKMAEARWFQTGAQSGFYVLTACTSGSTNNRMWIVTVMKKGDQLFVAGAVSDIAAQSMCISRISGSSKFLIGVTDRLREILNFDLAGAGWGASQQLYFDIIAGNQQTTFNTLNALRVDQTDQTIQWQIRSMDGSKSQTLNPFKQDNSYFARALDYGTRRKVRFKFPTTDDATREVKRVHLAYNKKARQI